MGDLPILANGHLYAVGRIRHLTASHLDETRSSLN